jgi:hypothetical protein
MLLTHKLHPACTVHVMVTCVWNGHPPWLTWHILQEDVQAVAGSIKLIANVANNVGVAQVLVALELLQHVCQHSARKVMSQ